MDMPEYEANDMRILAKPLVTPTRTQPLRYGTLLTRRWHWALAASLILVALVVLVSVWPPSQNLPHPVAGAPKDASLRQLPNPHPVYFGTEFANGFVQSSPSTFLPAVQREEAKIHHGLSIVTSYQGWGSTANRPFFTQMYELMRGHGSIPMISWAPENPSEPPSNQPDYTLESIIDGSHDTYINQWAEAAKAWDHPFFLRFGWEMNGNWYPWDELINNNKPGQFVQAWRHVHDIFTKDGVTNATWVWCPNKEAGNLTYPISEFYPGSAYVDWTCIDSYNTDSPPNGYVSFYTATRQTYLDILQLAPNKPMMIGETGTVEQGGNKPAWLTDLFSEEIPYNFPKIDAVLYYDVNISNQDPGQNYLVSSTQASLNAFNRAITLPIYTSNTYSNLPSGVIRAP